MSSVAQRKKIKKRKKIRQSNYCRVLVTETLPFETPIIFPNDGLYERVIDFDHDNVKTIEQKLIKSLVFDDKKQPFTIPYLYKIRKNSTEYRRLALLHPKSQWKIKEFYEKYENLILYHCEHSPASIRAPHKVASCFFFRNPNEDLYNYNEQLVSLVEDDDTTKNSPSFFSYRGHNRLYRFFQSRDYFELEKQYAHMLTLDVSKCFDSIYTHSMSWAVKDKEFTKNNLSAHTFALEFDRLMSHANYNETNGIVIGPEISRIFAEIILQDVDTQAIQRLKEQSGMTFGKEFCFRRYVDDVFIFSETAEIGKSVYNGYADVLMSFNLHVNAAKSVKLDRPFVTPKSRLIQETSREVNNFVSKFLQDGENKRLDPKPIYSPWKLSLSFIESIKTLCSYNQVNYDDVSGYLVAVLTVRIKKLIAADTIRPGDIKNYCNAIFVLLDVLYFLYQISPSVGASYNLSTSIILIIKFTKTHLSAHEGTIAQRIFELTGSLLDNLGRTKNNKTVIDAFIPLEEFNIALAVRELGEHYLFPESVLETLFNNDSYFSIISCFFYIKNETCYPNLRKSMVDKADAKLENLSDIKVNSEKAHLLLDLLSCPFVPDKKKRIWLLSAIKSLEIKKPSENDVSHFLKIATEKTVHVNWTKFDLLASLVKKELKPVY